MIELGTVAIDLISGFEGVAVARTERWHGAPQVALERTDQHGVPIEAWFYEGRLHQVDRPDGRAPSPGFGAPPH